MTAKRRWRSTTGGRLPVTVVVLLAVLVLVGILLGAPAKAAAFTDVAPDDWFAPAVNELADSGVVGGFPDGTFRPYDLVTRAQFAGMLARALSVPDAASHPFLDVGPDDWFAGAVAALYQAGLTSGVTADSFDPYGCLTREQAVTFIVRGLEYAGGPQAAGSDDAGAISAEIADVEAWLGAYRDRGYISVSHQWAVAVAYRAGIAGGYPEGRFFPFFSLTRAQATGMIFRALYQPIELMTDPPVPNPAEAYPVLRVGSTGDLVQWVEQRLAILTYDRGGVDGTYDESTTTGIMAFQKVEGLSRTGVCDAATLDRLLSAGPPAPRHYRTGDWVEVDLTRQVLMLMRGGALVKTLPISSGAWGMSTPTGEYRILYKSWGWVQVPLGWMYSPSYFRTSYAIHGSGSVPAWPASHGCVRTPVWATDELAGQLYVGLPVLIYY